MLLLGKSMKAVRGSGNASLPKDFILAMAAPNRDSKLRKHSSLARFVIKRCWKSLQALQAIVKVFFCIETYLFCRHLQQMLFH